jgi:hypothetical protein
VLSGVEPAELFLINKFGVLRLLRDWSISEMIILLMLLFNRVWAHTTCALLSNKVSCAFHVWDLPSPIWWEIVHNHRICLGQGIVPVTSYCSTCSNRSTWWWLLMLYDRLSEFGKHACGRSCTGCSISIARILMRDGVNLGVVSIILHVSKLVSATTCHCRCINVR